MARTLVLSFAVLALLAGAAAPCGAQPTPVVRTSQFDQQWLDTVVSIERLTAGGDGAPVGTGFVVISAHNHLVLVTTRHVVRDADGKLAVDLAYRLNRTGGASQLLKDADLVQAGGGAWFTSTEHDVAARFLPALRGASIRAIPLKLFVEAPQVEAGTPLAALGFPMGLRSVDHAKPIARRGMVGRADPAAILADLFVFPGNSGGPVLYVPAFKGANAAGTNVVAHEMLIGMVSSFIPYSDVAVSLQTQRPRVVFEQNSGLANLIPAWVVREFLTSGALRAMDERLDAAR
jgi:S1-C subfamily serine protease